MARKKREIVEYIKNEKRLPMSAARARGLGRVLCMAWGESRDIKPAIK